MQGNKNARPRKTRRMLIVPFKKYLFDVSLIISELRMYMQNRLFPLSGG